jgi:hypothetical protein
MTSTAGLRAQIRAMEDAADELDIQAELQLHAADIQARLQDAERVAEGAAESARTALAACAPVRSRAHHAAQRVAQLSNVIADKSLPVDVLAEARTQRRSYQDEGADIIAQLDQAEAAAEQAQLALEIAVNAVDHLRATLAVAHEAVNNPLTHPAAKATDAYRLRIMRGLWVGVLFADSNDVPDRAIANQVLDAMLTQTKRGEWVLREDRREAAAIARRAQEYADVLTESADLNRMATAMTNRLQHDAPPPPDLHGGPSINAPARTVVPTYSGGRLGA